MSDPVLAVVDIGSNSIKILVAAAQPSALKFRVLFQKTLETRISKGLGADKSKLSEAGMEAGIDGVRRLLDLAKPYAPTHFNIVATSAVRDAGNRDEFAARVRTATRTSLEVLSGKDEALLIASGIQTDPALGGVREFCVMDLGGGSLECIRSAAGKIEQAISLPLGAVRLTEKYVSNPRGAFEEAARAAVAAETRKVFTGGGFHFIPDAPLVGTGGAFAVARAILAHRKGFLAVETWPAEISRNELANLLDEIAPLEAEARAKIPGLTAERADIMPAALTTILVLLEIAQADRVLHSFNNLRFGVAARFFAQGRE